MIARAAGRPVAGVPLRGLAFPRPRRLRSRGQVHRTAPLTALPLFAVARFPGAPMVGIDVYRRAVPVARPAPSPAPRVRWRGLALALVAGLVLGGGAGVAGRHYLNQQDVVGPLPGATVVHPLPISAVSSVDQTQPSPPPLPERLLLQVPYTTQAPDGNWAQRQHTCEEANLTMLSAYWQHDPSVVIDPPKFLSGSRR